MTSYLLLYFIYLYTHTYIYICTHTHTHLYIYVHTLSGGRRHNRHEDIPEEPEEAEHEAEEPKEEEAEPGRLFVSVSILFLFLTHLQKSFTQVTLHGQFCYVYFSYTYTTVQKFGIT